ncbi:MAG: hypothetical protein M1832_005924 [Thelocarpon impressellum]|nr:MAG: hypothetical protein M1832_005924 [Thelocarpon impressellum]
MFRLFPINQAVGLPEKVPDVTFGEADLEVVRHVKREIIASTTPRDLLLFLGNGGAYFYYSFKPADDRNVHLIPLSGKCMDSGYTDAAPLAKYKAEILVPAFKPGNFDRLILIDHVMTGESLRDFTKLLSSLGFLNKGYFEKLTPYVINLAYSRDLEDAFPGGIPRFQDNVIESKVKILKELTVGPGIEPLFRFDQAKFGRILPSYPRMVWQHSIHDIPNADREVGESIVRQIMADRIGA